jgi:hypothetical protein
MPEMPGKCQDYTINIMRICVNVCSVKNNMLHTTCYEKTAMDEKLTVRESRRECRSMTYRTAQGTIIQQYKVDAGFTP